MSGQPAVRVVRPRPLGVNDRIPVFWPGQEPSQELKQIDGGALYKHLVDSNTPPTKTNKKRKRSQYQAPREGAPHEHFSPLRWNNEQQAAGPIVVPRVRDVADYNINQQAAAHHGPMIEGDIAAAPYLRHKEHPDMYEEHQIAEYDADEDDVEWISSINSHNKNGQTGFLAAAIGLYHQVSARISGSSEVSAGSEPPQQLQQQHQQLRLSVEEFERAVDLLEEKHFEAVKAWWEEQQSGPSTSTPRVPKIPPMKQLLPRAAALEALSGVLPDRKLAAQVLDYWLKKRAEAGGPLLPHLWFEQPWKLVAFAHHIIDDDEDFDEDLPFMAVEPRSKQKVQGRRAAARRRINEDDALEALYSLRNELETVRTLADQVRKREKLKRQLLLVSQQEWQMRRQLGLPPSKVPRQQANPSQAADAAGPSGRAAAAAAAAGAGRAAAAAAAAGAGADAAPGPLSPRSEMNRVLAKVALAAAAAASPQQGDKGRQTRTAAAAAAAEFEMTFAAKRRRIMGAGAAAVAAAGDGVGTAAPEASGKAAAEPGRRPSNQGTAAAAGQGSKAAASGRQPPRRQSRLAAADKVAAAATAGEGEAVDGLAAAGVDELDEQPSSSAAEEEESDRGESSSSEDEYDEEGYTSDAAEALSGLEEEEEELEAEVEPVRQRRSQAVQPAQQMRRQRQEHRRVLRDRGRPGATAAAGVSAAAAAAAKGDAAGLPAAGDDGLSQQQPSSRLRKHGQQRVVDGVQGQQQDISRLVQKRQQPKHRQQQAQEVPGEGVSRRNDYVPRTLTLPAAGSSSEQRAEGDSGGDGDHGVKPPRRNPRSPQRAAAATAAAPAPAAAPGRKGARATDVGAHAAANSARVLKPHNQQQKQLRGHDAAAKVGHKALPAAAAAVASKTGQAARVAAAVAAGEVVPARGGKHGAGVGSVRRSAAAIAAAGHAAADRRRRPAAPRRAIGKAELRSLGLPDAASPRKRAR